MTMRHDDDLNLRDAFSPMPDDCREALRRAVRSCKEEPMKRFSRRALLIAAALIVLTVAAAYAVGQLGLSDMFSRYYDLSIPGSTREALSSTVQKTYEAGPLKVTVREALADGRIAYITGLAQAPEGRALVQMSNGDADEPLMPETAAHFRLPEGTGFAEAARLTGYPLYFVSFYLSPEEGVINAEEMYSAVWEADGSALLIQQMPTEEGLVGDALTGTLTIRVRQYDPEQNAFMEGRDWRIDEEYTIPVRGIEASKTYVPEGEAEIAGYRVKSVLAEKSVAGVYMTAVLEAGETGSRDNVWDLYELIGYGDEEGKALPEGISLSGWLENSAWPEVGKESMLGIDTLPDTLTIINTQSGETFRLK